MKAKIYTGITLLILSVFFLSACGAAKPTATAAPVLPLPSATPSLPAPAATVSPTMIPSAIPPTKAAATLPATPVATATGGSVVVVTATGMFDVGTELGNQPMTAIPGNDVVWDELAKMPDWKMDIGLSRQAVYYIQSGVPNTIGMPKFPDGSKVVPPGASLIFGAYAGSATINGKVYANDHGYYAVLLEGTKIDALNLTDGFALLIKSEYAKDEYCQRIAQAMNEKWAPFDGKQPVEGHLYRPATWTDPVCSGVITTPLDSDR